MRACKVCGSNNFDVNDALFYCQECGTQFADFCAEEKGDDAFGDGGPPATSLIISSQKKPRKKEPKTIAPKRTWLTFEAFNIILRRQVESLIHLGAPTELADVVLQIWAAYLRKCGVCFKSEVIGNGWIPPIDFSPLIRDLRILCGEKSLKRDEKLKLELDDQFDGDDFEKNQDSCSVKDVDLLDSKPTIEEALVTLNELSDAVVSFPARNIPYSFSLKRKYLRSNQRGAFCMTLSKTVSFCYLGLLCLQDQILLSDMIRFAREGHFLYLDAVRCLPEDMELCNSDRDLFVRSSLPKMKSLINFSSRIAKDVGFPAVKHHSLLPIASRLIKNMNLPNDLICYVRVIVSMIPSSISWRVSTGLDRRSFPSIEPYEVVAMAYILVALKLIFGLNDEIESKHSCIVQKINSVSQIKSKLFVFDDWYLAQRSRSEFLKNQCVSFSNFSQAIDVDSLSRYYYCNVSNWMPKNDAKAIHKCDTKEYRNSMRTVFSRLVSYDPPAKVVSPPTSFPWSSRTNCIAKTAASSLQYSLVPGRHWESLQENFSSYSAIYSWEDFRKRNRDVPGWCKDMFVQLDELSCSLVEADEYSDDDDEMGAYNSRKFPLYWFVNSSRRTSKLFVDHLPQCFRWLLRFSSELVECSEEDLYYEISQIEKSRFVVKKKSKSCATNTDNYMDCVIAEPCRN